MDPIIKRIGGEPKVQELVGHFYDLIESVPQGREILGMHLKGHGLAHTRTAQFEFLCGFFGGRQYYKEHHGHMNLREIHAHVEIRKQDAEDWLAIMDKAMTDKKIADHLKQQIHSTLQRAAMMLVNVME